MEVEFLILALLIGFRVLGFDLDLTNSDFLNCKA